MGGGSSRKKAEPRGEDVIIHQDEKCSYQEIEKNHWNNWICVKKDGELMNINGEDGVLKFDDLQDIQSVTPAFRRL